MPDMASDIFHFKKFSIKQSQTAMKVGTDGVLLGAWANAENTTQILDVGTGTGLIALMMAQRFPSAEITGIEIENRAFNQAKESVDNSIFNQQVEVINCDFLKWETETRFDLIVCNPPFYLNWHSAENESRSIARHGNPNQLMDWINKSQELLTEDGVICLIIPVNYFDFLCENVNELYFNKLCWVKPNSSKPAHRVLVEMSRIKSACVESEIEIEQNVRHHYSELYVNLCKDFYLNF
jgi:tRNA1Val (adenine37-N6)-methyltransferase